MSSLPELLSSWALGISPSPTLAIDAKAKAMLAAGENVCSFAAGEPDFDTPSHIKDAAIAALRAGKTKYAATPGIEPLREAIAARYASDYGLKVAPSQVVVSPGGKFSCYLAVLAVCSPGDEVVIPAPYWVSYPEMVKLAGAVPKPVLAGDATGFRITAAQLEAAITKKTKLLILNSPSNPTGAVYPRAELEAIVGVALKHNLYILSDEIYEHLLYDGVRHVTPASLGREAEARTIVVSGFSKTYAMTGWRLGTLVAPPRIAKAVGELQSQMAHQRYQLCPIRRAGRAQGEGAHASGPADHARRFRPPQEIPPCRTRKNTGRPLRPGPGGVLPLSEHLQFRDQLPGLLRAAAAGREGGGRSGQRIRRRGIRPIELRNQR